MQKGDIITFQAQPNQELEIINVGDGNLVPLRGYGEGDGVESVQLPVGTQLRRAKFALAAASYTEETQAELRKAVYTILPSGNKTYEMWPEAV